MEITFRKIIDVLSIDAPVHYTPREQLNKENYVFCRTIGSIEEQAVNSGTYDPNLEYDGYDMGLHFPDISVDEYYLLEVERNSTAIFSLVNALSNQMITYNSEFPILWAIHCVLHEYGHWQHFLDSGMSAYEYTMLQTKERRPFNKLVNEIRRVPVDDFFKEMLAQKYETEIYSQFSSEQYANKYSAEHIMKAIELVRNSCGYTEEDMLKESLKM